MSVREIEEGGPMARPPISDVLQKWAAEEFGSLSLSNRPRERRCRQMAAAAAAHPAGSITATFERRADRDRVYKLLAQHPPSPLALSAATAEAAFARVADADGFLPVPIDQCTLSPVGASFEKGFGRVGASSRACGAESMHALLLDPQGVPQGLLSQVFWARTGPKRPRGRKTRHLPFELKETFHWVRVMSMALDAWLLSRTRQPLWFQLDAGANAREVIQYAVSQLVCLTTIRCRADRRLHSHGKVMLSEALAASRSQGFMQVQVPQGPRRKARKALLELKSERVVLRLRNPQTKTVALVTMYAVRAQEQRTVPGGEKKVEWTLLTTRPVATPEEAEEVVRMYALRWRVEEVHRSWKSGCKVEQSQVKYSAYQPWATILMSVAIRTERLKRLAREQPQLPAEQELVPSELEALTLLNPRAKELKRTGKLQLGEAVRCVAELGGYMGSPSSKRGPPGSVVIQRGLEKLSMAAEIIELQRATLKSD